jgi:YD repeat-containing protein
MSQVSSDHRHGSRLSWRLASILAACLAVAGTPEASAAHAPNEPPPENLERAFAEPLVALRRPSSPRESAALSRALAAYRAASDSERTEAIEAYLRDHPSSPWNASLLLNLGNVQRRNGRFTHALRSWERAWRLTRALPEAEAATLAGAAAGQLVELNAALGRSAVVQRLLQEIGARPLAGAAAEQVAGARRALHLMASEPAVAFRCGPLALAEVAAALGERALPARVRDYPSTARGTSLAELEALAREAGLRLRLARRAPRADVLVPAVMHWKAGHFAAVVRAESERYLIKDLTFGEDLWVSRATLDEEASGFALVRADTPLPAGWRGLARAPARAVRGRGATGNPRPGATTPLHPKLPRRCAPRSPRGMPVYDAHAAIVSLNITDVPVGYTPPRGPVVEFQLTYNSREASQPATFNFSNLGPRWTHNWLSYIEDDPTRPEQTVKLIERGGGHYFFGGFTATGFQTGTFTRNFEGGHEVLSRAGATYTRTYPDGSREVYAHSDGGATTRRVFLTASADPYGNTVSLQYDASLRLIRIDDALGQATLFAYESAADARKITRVTDPFGRTALLQYDGSGRLASITDAAGLTATFAYGPYPGNPTAPPDFINAATTPYGTTRFALGEIAGQAGGASARWIEITDPLGGRERIEFTHQAPGVAASTDEPVPAGFLNSFLQYRNSFYWDARAMQAYDAADPQRYANATVVQHWLHDGTGSTALASSLLESLKAYGERRLWFAYPGQADTQHRGSLSLPSVVARVLDDGREQRTTFEYDSAGRLQRFIDAVGRRHRYVYTAAGDLSEVWNELAGGSGERLALVEYDARRLPVRSVGHDGRASVSTYNAWGQPTSLTRPDGRVLSLTYDARGFLSGAAVVGTTRAAQFFYDAVGRPRTFTVTDEAAGPSWEYDALDRVTSVSFPDGSAERVRYERLDAVEHTNRQGLVTRYAYDPLRRLVRSTDAAQRETTYEWCTCDALAALVDPSGARTEWTYDSLGRLLSRSTEGVVSASYAYDSAGRVVGRTDALGQLTSYSYNIDDTLAGVDYTSALHATPSARYLWDAFFPRLRGVDDASGATRYSYYAAGVDGAGQVAAIDGPVNGQRLTLTYDLLGRATGRALDGVSATVGYDALDRATLFTSPLGTTQVSYQGSSERPLVITHPNGLSANYGYASQPTGFALSSLDFRSAGGLVYASSSYAREARSERLARIDEGVRSTTFAYDVLGQLVAAGVSSGPLEHPYRYTYDVNGNRVSRSSFGNTTTWTFDAWNQVLRMTPGPSGALWQERLFDTLRELAAPARPSPGDARRDEEQGGAR